MLLAAMAAIAVLMLAATPAMAADLDEDGFEDFVEEFCEDFDGDGFCEEFFEEFCEDFDGDFFCDEDDFFDGFNGDGISQNFEQEAESGDVDQTFYVSNTGDNSNQTIGITGVVNTGNVQDQTGFIQTGTFGDENGDGFCDEFEEFCEDFVDEFCEDLDGDGFCEEFFEEFFFDNFDGDRFDGDRFDGDRFDGHNNFGDEFEFEDIGSDLTVSGNNVVTSDQQVNQAAVANFGKGWWY